MGRGTPTAGARSGALRGSTADVRVGVAAARAQAEVVDTAAAGAGLLVSDGGRLPDRVARPPPLRPEAPAPPVPVSLGRSGRLAGTGIAPAAFHRQRTPTAADPTRGDSVGLVGSGW